MANVKTSSSTLRKQMRIDKYLLQVVEAFKGSLKIKNNLSNFINPASYLLTNADSTIRESC
jgi:hypothetical protein